MAEADSDHDYLGRRVKPCSEKDLTELAVKVEALEVKIKALDRLLTAQISAQDEKVQLALSSAEKAISKAEVATERRFEGVNEFRAALSDQAQAFANRDAVDTSFGTMRQRIDDLSSAVSRQLILLLSSIVGVLVAALIFAATR